MPKFKLTATWPVLDRESYLRDFRAAIDQAMIKAARKFLLAAVPQVPIFTGFARSAFGNLEDLAGRVQNGRIRGTLKASRKEKRYQKKDYYYYPPGGGKVLRTNISGKPYGTKSKDIFSQGRLTKATTQTRMIFKFAIDITYFDKLDSQWGAFKAGQAAFDAEFKTQFDRLKPRIGKYLIRREVK